MNSSRIDYIDVVKGFAILLLLLSHSIPGEGLIKTWIFSFHMPIFFIVSGYLHSFKGIVKIKDYLKKRKRNLIIPYFLFGFVLTLFYLALDYIALSKNELIIESFKERILRLVSMQGIDSLWFLPTYFFSELLYVLLKPLKLKWHLLLLIIAIAALCLVPQPLQAFYKLFYRIVLGFVFIEIGFLFGTLIKVNKIPTYLCILSLLLFSISSYHNGFASMNQVHNVILYCMNAVGISLALIALFARCEMDIVIKKILIFYGIGSLIIVCTNNILIEIIRLLDYKMLGSIMLQSGLLGCLCFFIIVSISEIPLIYKLRGLFVNK